MADTEYNSEELIELVAEFAEIPGHLSEDDDRWVVPRLSAADYDRTGLTRGRTWWDPRIDNGDAMQLAVRLGIDTYTAHISLSGKRTVSAGKVDGPGLGVECLSKSTGDNLAAMRRAIFGTAVKMAQEASS